MPRVNKIKYSDIISNMKKNKLSIIFCCAILIYVLVLYINTFTFNASARVYPQLFIILTSVPAILKIILSLTELPLLKTLDSLTSTNAEETAEEAPNEEQNNKTVFREYFAIFSYISFFIFIYLFGFTVGVFIFVLFFSYFNFKSWKKSFVIALSLSFSTYLVSELLMTQAWSGFLFQMF